MDITLDCGHTPSAHSSITTGYGIDQDGKKHCYDCCGVRDRDKMIRDGKAILYLCGDTKNGGDIRVTNWPGSLCFHVYHLRKGYHNMAGTRYDVWFTGPDGKQWHGIQYGENTQICHCQRLKTA